LSQQKPKAYKVTATLACWLLFIELFVDFPRRFN